MYASTTRCLAVTVACLTFSVSNAQSPALPWPDGWHAPDGQPCHALDVRGGLPAVETLLDTAVVTSVMGWSAGPPARGFVVWSIAFDSTGAVLRVITVASDLPDSASVRLVNTIASVIEPQPRRGRWSMQLRLRLGDGSQFSVAPSELCEATPISTPSPEKSTGVATIVIAVEPGHRVTDDELRRAVASQSKHYLTELRVLVSPQGVVVAPAEIVISAGDAAIDAKAQFAAMRSRYLPQLVDRMPVAGYAKYIFRQTKLPG